MISQIFVDVCRDYRDMGWSLEHTTDVELFEKIVGAAEQVRPAAPLLDDELLPDAESLASRLTSGWFSERTPTREQAHFASVPTAPRIAVRPPNPNSQAVYDEKPHGAWWTSSILPDGTSCWSRAESVIGTALTRARGEDAARVEQREQWDVSTAVIHRIESPADYAWLLEEYPLHGEGRPRVDWVRVADDFDAVHLSARGLVYTQGVPVETSRGWTALRGWNCESTAWLRDPGRGSPVTGAPADLGR